jgi:hypothetical protein
MATSDTLSVEEERYYKELFGSLRRIKDRYTYEGSVIFENGHTQRHWYAATYATSAKKAKSNLMYQYKVEHGLPINTKIDLPGILMIG